jgi:hypothetical protein
MLFGFLLLTSTANYLLGCGSGLDEYKIPAQQQALNVGSHVKSIPCRRKFSYHIVGAVKNIKIGL